VDKFVEMRAFAAVVDAGSFVKAADALQVSKTGISRLVSDLEARLGLRLLQRTTRKLSLTTEGEIFHHRCVELLQALEDAEGEVTARGGEAVGLVRVNVPVSFGMTYLAPLWPLFMELHPQVALDVTLSDRVVDLVDEAYDLAVRIARLPNSTLVSRKIASTRLTLCASPEYLRRHGTPAHPLELAQHAVIAYTLLAMGDQWQFEGDAGPVTVKVKPRMRSNSGDTCCVAAVSGQGFVLEPTFLVGPYLRSGELVEVLPRFRSADLGVYAVYPTRKYVPPKVRALIEFLAQSFRGNTWPA
jgi:DNA-binding transcriptional LysR family regulator